MKLLEQVRQVARVKHFSYRTKKAYVYWAERYIRFHGIRHPNLLGTPEIERFLTHLAAGWHWQMSRRKILLSVQAHHRLISQCSVRVEQLYLETTGDGASFRASALAVKKGDSVFSSTKISRAL